MPTTTTRSQRQRPNDQSSPEKSPRRRRLTSQTDVVISQFSFEEDKEPAPPTAQGQVRSTAFPQNDPDEEEDEEIRDGVALGDKGYHADPCNNMSVRRGPMSERIGSWLMDPEPVESSESSEEESIEECVLGEILSKGRGLEREEGLGEALALYKSAVREGLVEECLNVAYLEYRMGTLLWKCGSYEKSLALLKRAKDVFEREGGMHVHVLAEIYFALGRSLASLCHRKRARRYFMKALRNLEYDQFVDNIVRSEDQELYARILTQVACLLISHGGYEMASEVLSEAITMQRSILGPQHLDIAATLLVYGSLNEALHQYEYAAKCYLEALEIYRSNKSTSFASNVDISVALSSIGWLFYLTQDYSSALHSYEEALELVVPILGDTHRNVSSLRVQMGMVYAQQKQYKGAVKIYRKALQGQRTVLGDQHEDVALTLALVGSVYKDLGKHRKALEFTQRALSIRQQLDGFASTRVGMTFAQLGHIYLEMGEIAAASHCFTSTLTTFYEQSLPSADSRVADAQECMARIRALGR